MVKKKWVLTSREKPKQNFRDVAYGLSSILPYDVHSCANVVPFKKSGAAQALKTMKHIVLLTCLHIHTYEYQ